PLYHLPELAAAATVFVTEGEKAADLARGLGVVATTSAHGAKSAPKSDWGPLAGKDVVILPDADPEGESYATAVLGLLARLRPRPRVRVVRLAALWGTAAPIPEGGGLAEWLRDGVPDSWEPGRRREELERVAGAAPLIDLDAHETPGAKAKADAPRRRGGQDERGRETHAETLLRLAAVAELTRTDDGRAYARVPVADHYENHEVRSAGLKRWLRYRFYREQGRPPSGDGLQGALDILEARAQIDGATAPVYVRVAPADDGAVFIDLGDDSWRAVRVGPEGWVLVERPPVRFRRPSGLRALPIPERGGAIRDLLRFRFVNVAAADFLLLVAWLTAALLSTGPYPVLTLTGEQGSAKSTLARLLRLLIDPHASPLRSEPKEPRDLMISATNGWIVALDNLSTVPPWLSDALCRLATGGGFATRPLYTDNEEIILSATRPTVLTGLEEFVPLGDLTRRAAFL